VINIIILFVGGLGMFLLGMRMMSDGLKATSSDKIKRILTLLTRNRIIAVLLGAGLTALIQSSSGMTVITVGLVNSGLLTLRQAIGVVMGANIGTTLTAWLVSFIGVFRISDYALIAVGIGFFLTLAPRGKSYKSRGQVLIGLGLLFLGLGFMKDAFQPLRESATIMNAFMTLSAQPLLAVLVGALATVILQSSSATIAIVQLLAYQGLINFDAAVPLVLGENIGTTITAQIAALNTNTNARRTAMAHTLFNVIGACYILPLVIFGTYQKLIYYIMPFQLSLSNIMIFIAVAHSAFNIINALLMLPLTGWLERGSIFLTPKAKKEVNGAPQYLDRRLLKSPATALVRARLEVLRMARMCREALELSLDSFLNKDSRNFKQLNELEDAIDNLQEEITLYLVDISQQSLEPSQSDELPVWMHSVNDLERIGDHTQNLMELTERSIRIKVELPEEAKTELLTMFRTLIEMGDSILLAIEDNNREKAYKALSCEDKINRLFIEFRDAQIQRLNAGICKPVDGIVFIDVLNNLEKIGDHLTNIAQAVLRDFQFSYGEVRPQPAAR
jgi:phosphate:Na+ symporter